MATKAARTKARIIFQADWQPFSSQFVGVVMAQRLGYYQKAGLEVLLRPPVVHAGAEPDVVAAVQEAAQATLTAKAKPVLALGSAEQNVVVPAQANGLPILAISAMFQTSPLSLALRPDASVKRFSDLTSKHTVGMLADSLRLTDVLLRHETKDTKAGGGLARIVEVTNANKVDMLIKGEVDAIQVYGATEPIEIEGKLGKAPIVIPIGAPLGYAQVIFGHSAVLRSSEAHRKAAKAFLKATYQGWKHVISAPHASARDLVEERRKAQQVQDGDVDDELRFEEDSIKRVLKLVAPKKATKIGVIDPKRWAEANEFMFKAGLIPSALDVAHTVDASLVGVVRTQTGPRKKKAEASAE